MTKKNFIAIGKTAHNYALFGVICLALYIAVDKYKNGRPLISDAAKDKISYCANPFYSKGWK